VRIVEHDVAKESVISALSNSQKLWGILLDALTQQQWAPHDLILIPCNSAHIASPYLKHAFHDRFVPIDEAVMSLIGREGRNIRALERATGVEFVIDEVPDAIVISSFDPYRREVARLALAKLVKDGRIQPAKIEEKIFTSKGFYQVNLDIPGIGGLTIINVHMTAGGLRTHPEGKRSMDIRSRQIRQLLQHLPDDQPAIITGDINAGPESSQENYLQLNEELSQIWPVITQRKDPPEDADEWDGKPGKRALLER